jgi:hypothetical protein
VLGLLSGCASVSEYSQGCRDGADEVLHEVNYLSDTKYKINEKKRNDTCDQMDKARKQSKDVQGK